MSIIDDLKASPRAIMDIPMQDIVDALLAADEMATQCDNWLNAGQTCDFSIQEALSTYRNAVEGK